MSYNITPTGEATGAIYFDHLSPIKVFGTDKIRDTFGETTLQQAVNARFAPGVVDVVLTPDAHVGFGAPIGCIMASPTHIYPGPAGVDISCSMSLLQLDLPEDAIADKRLRRAIINAICARIPNGYGKGRAGKKPDFPVENIEQAMTQGATEATCQIFNVPVEWIQRCEEPTHVGHCTNGEILAERLEQIKFDITHGKGSFRHYAQKLTQIGSYGGGNHFGECEIVRLSEYDKNIVKDESRLNVAKTFGLIDGNVAFLSHCGSRGLGNALAKRQFKLLQEKFKLWNIPLPGEDPELVYAPLDTPEANDYIDDMALAANFATMNHLIINALVLEAFQEVIPGITGRLVYHISHNIARREIVNNRPMWIHRKGATRAYPAGHFALAKTPFADTGHPILLPGNPTQGSSVMVGLEGASSSLYSVNHGAGRAMGRRVANQTLDQQVVDQEFNDADILTNCRFYPKDEAPAAYKDFNEVLHSVEVAGLAREVARLQARFVIKDSSAPDD